MSSAAATYLRALMWGLLPALWFYVLRGFVSALERPVCSLIVSAGGIGVNATSPDELARAVNEAMDSGKPTLINAVIDEKAGTESGRIGNLNPQSVVGKKANKPVEGLETINRSAT